MANPDTLVHAAQAEQFFRDRGKQAMAGAIRALIDESTAKADEQRADASEEDARIDRALADLLEPEAVKALGVRHPAVLALSQAISARSLAQSAALLASCVLDSDGWPQGEFVTREKGS